MSLFFGTIPLCLTGVQASVAIQRGQPTDNSWGWQGICSIYTAAHSPQEKSEGVSVCSFRVFLRRVGGCIEATVEVKTCPRER